MKIPVELEKIIEIAVPIVNIKGKCTFWRLACFVIFVKGIQVALLPLTNVTVYAFV